MVARGRRLTVTLVVVLVAVVIAGLGTAFAIGRDQRASGEAAATGSVSAPTSGADGPGGPTDGARPSTGTGVTTRSSDQAAAPPATQTSGHPAAPTSARNTGGAPDGVEVTLSAEARSSRYADEVAALLQRYFDAINAHDYQAWTQVVTPAQAKHWAKDEWEGDYSTTADSDIYVSDINDGAPMSVRIQFVSHQDVKHAPTSLPVTCVNWDVIYRLEVVDGGLRVGTSVRDPYLVACR